MTSAAAAELARPTYTAPVSDRDTKLQQLSVSVGAVIASVPMILQGDEVTTALGLAGVGIASVIENVRARTGKLDRLVQEALADEQLKARFDETVKTDEFLALYVRSRDTAAKSEKERKLRYIRNFLIHSVITPTSTEPDKERYLRLIDELSFREHESFIGYLRMLMPSAGASSLEEWVANDRRQIAGGMVTTYAYQLLGVPSSTSSPAVHDMTSELVVTFRHLHSTGLLDGISTRGGDMVQFQSNGFTPRFLRFVLDPF